MSLISQHSPDLTSLMLVQTNLTDSLEKFNLSLLLSISAEQYFRMLRLSTSERDRRAHSMRNMNDKLYFESGITNNMFSFLVGCVLIDDEIVMNVKIRVKNMKMRSGKKAFSAFVRHRLSS